MDREQLTQAYHATAYCAQLEAGELCLRVGVPAVGLDRALSERNVREWAFVTSDNPGSVPRIHAENVRERARLIHRVRTAGYDAVTCVARSDSGDWPDEQGLLIFGIALNEALSLARDFGQNAILAGRHGEAPALVFCR